MEVKSTRGVVKKLEPIKEELSLPDKTERAPLASINYLSTKALDYLDELFEQESYDQLP